MASLPNAASPERILRASGLGKAYLLGRSRLRPLMRRLVRGGDEASAPGAFWAVREVSAELAHGESLGVIGRNGSGKSTLLRLLAGVSRPTQGRVEIGGRMGCLLDLGVGFHPLETGRQNAEGWLVLLGGLSRREARQAAREVERFAEVGPYFDRPLRTYSAGMQVRVAFATATMLEPELLVADEVLAVGDEAFQHKCDRFFDRFLARGGSLVLCTHDLSQAQRLCEWTLWLDGGRVAECGETREVVRHYREHVGSAPAGAADEGEADAGARHAPGEPSGLAFEVVDLHLRDEWGAEVRLLAPGSTVVVTADVHAPAAVPHLHIGLVREDMTPVYGVSSDMDGAVPADLGGGRYRYRLTFPRLPLCAGRYRLRAHALDETATRLYDTVEIDFAVEGDDGDLGLVRFPFP